MTKFRQIKSPGALAAFGAFFVPEPFGICVVLASAIWWLTGITAMAELVSDEHKPTRSLTSSQRDQPILTRLQYVTLFALGSSFLIGLWITVQAPSHRLQDQIVYGGNASGMGQDRARLDIPPLPAPK